MVAKGLGLRLFLMAPLFDFVILRISFEEADGLVRISPNAAFYFSPSDPEELHWLFHQFSYLCKVETKDYAHGVMWAAQGSLVERRAFHAVPR